MRVRSWEHELYNYLSCLVSIIIGCDTKQSSDSISSFNVTSSLEIKQLAALGSKRVLLL